MGKLALLALFVVGCDGSGLRQSNCHFDLVDRRDVSDVHASSGDAVCSLVANSLDVVAGGRVFHIETPTPLAADGRARLQYAQEAARPLALMEMPTELGTCESWGGHIAWTAGLVWTVEVIAAVMNEHPCSLVRLDEELHLSAL